MARPRNVNSAKHKTGCGRLSGTFTATASASGRKGKSDGAQERTRARLAEQTLKEITELERQLVAQRIALFGGSGTGNPGSAP